MLLDKGAGVRSSQRLALGDVAGGIALLTWPAELQTQATYLYNEGRGQRLLAAAQEGKWDVDTRPHLAFWLSKPEERLYMNPTIGREEYVARWSGPDFRHIGQHGRNTIRTRLWPWLLQRGYASAADEAELEPFIERLEKRKRDAHVRPGLRLLRRWERAEIERLRENGQLVATIRAELNQLLAAVDDPPLPACHGVRA